jgi:DNA invertase Pin-like site-specific DNA recombinase
MPGFRPAWLIVTEMGIDTRMPMGKAMAHMARVFAELERDPRIRGRHARTGKCV